MVGSPSPRGSFAAQLRALRLAASLSQEELADRAGLTVNAVGALERGERQRPYPHTVRALADALALDPAARSALSASVPAPGSRRGLAPQLRAEPSDDQRLPAAGSDTSMSLSAPPTPLIGRADEVTSLAGLLAAGTRRLVTLTGPGGVGKTRLAWEVGSRLLAHFNGSVVFVDLAPVDDAATVLRTIAHALGLRDLDSSDIDDSSSASAVVGFLGHRPTLLVLDNLEHVLACAPLVSDLVARCPGLVVLATSRAPLRVRAELEVPLPPLEVPDPRAVPDAAGIADSAAVRMLLSRAEAAGSPLAVTEQNAATIAAICWRLDGIPLALELAAARLRLLSPASLLARLDDAVGAGGMRDAPERQRTMRATVQWSYDLLQDPERWLFRRLSVFVGGFSLEAAEAVSDGADDPLAVLSALGEQSLVTKTVGVDVQQERFRLLEPVRQYAAELLSGTDDVEPTLGQYADHFCGVAREARAGLRSKELTSELARLEQDHGNLRSTMQHLLDHGRRAEAAGLDWDLWLYWGLRGHVAEGLGWVTSLLNGHLDGPDRCLALGAAAGLRFVSGEIAAMHPLADEALELARVHGKDDRTVAETAVLAGSARMYVGDLSGAEEILLEALSRARDAGDVWAEAHALTALAQQALLDGDAARSGRLLTTAEERARSLGNAFTLTTVLNVRATLTELLDDAGTAADLLTEAIEVSTRARLSWTRVYTLTALAGIAVRSGQAETAARLFGAAASLSSAHLVDARFPASRDLADGHIAEVRLQLGEEGFRCAFDAGRSATPAQVAELAVTVRRYARG